MTRPPSPALPSLHDRHEAWLRGELDPAESERFLAAASTDPALAAEVAAEAELIARVRGLPAERSPERDLWPEIAARLAPARPARGGRRAFRFAAAAAAAAAIAAGVAFLTRSPAPTSANASARPSAAPPAAEPTPAAVPAAYASIGAELDTIRDRLRGEVERRSAELPPAARVEVFENLATIDRAIAAIESELAARPDDASLARTSIAYRQRQLELLRRVNQTAARL